MRQRGERIEVERRAHAALEVEQAGARDHRGVVRREARRSARTPRRPRRLHALAHRGASARLHATPPPSTTRCASELLGRARRLLDERVDDRVLKGARDVRVIASRPCRARTAWSTAVLSPLNETS